MRSLVNLHAAVLAVSVALGPVASLARAADNLLPPLPVTPHKTAVLLLPPLDSTPDAAHMLGPRQSVVRHREEYEFITRQFVVLGESLATRAAAIAPAVDLGNLSARTPANFDVLAQRAAANWVVSFIVESAKLDATADGGFTAHTRVLLQVWDARRHGWLAHAEITGSATGDGTPVFLFKDSLDHAVKDALAPLLQPYLPIISVSQETTLLDYLAGQTAPFVGDPAKPFAGLPASP